MKQCPYCAEQIQDEAIKCRYCSSDLEWTPSVSSTNLESTASRPPFPAVRNGRRRKWVVIGVVIGVALCSIAVWRVDRALFSERRDFDAKYGYLAEIYGRIFVDAATRCPGLTVPGDVVELLLDDWWKERESWIRFEECNFGLARMMKRQQKLPCRFSAKGEDGAFEADLILDGMRGGVDEPFTCNNISRALRREDAFLPTVGP